MNEQNHELVLWTNFKNGDREAFSSLYQNYVKILYRYGHRVSSDTQLIEDAIQDMFVELWNSRKNLSKPDSVKFYLFRVLRRKLTRSQLRASNTETINEQEAITDLTTHSIEQEILAREIGELRLQNLYDAIRRLPDRQREAINLRYFHEFSPQQIADIMGISLQSVHNTFQKAFKLLREVISSNPDLLILLCILYS